MPADYWNTLLVLKSSDFRYPDLLDPNIVKALDQLAMKAGIRPIILSDYRPNDPRTHGKGQAIDTTWPGLDPIYLWTTARNSHLFSGLGIYVNDLGAVSFHFDKRPDRTPNDPALWGGLISHPWDASLGEHVKKIDYTTMTAIIDVIKKKSTLILFISGIALYAISKLTKRRGANAKKKTTHRASRPTRRTSRRRRISVRRRAR